MGEANRWAWYAMRVALILFWAAIISAWMRWEYRRGFDAGVQTTLCALDAGDGKTETRACHDLAPRQRAYAIKVGQDAATPMPMT